jgi:predicted RNase H-related nuclease YkuK (DUF458 family)
MDKYFWTEEGERVNIVEHTLEQIEKWPNLTIRIGTDSQNYSGITRYVTTIVYRYGNRGAHYIYYKEEVPRIRVEYNRLYDEGVRTIDAAELLTADIPVAVEALEFDFADVKKTISSQLVSVFKNWGNFNAVFKSGQMIACKAADHICRR